MSATDELFRELSTFELPPNIGRVESRTLSVPDCEGVLAFINNWGLTNIDGIRKGAEIIRSLALQFRFEVVFVDGASGPSDFSVWDAFHPLMREWFAEKQMLKGYISPAEMAVVVFPESGVELFGIDDPPLYRGNWGAARKLARMQSDVVATLRRLQSSLSNLMPVLSVDTRRLVETQDAYEAAHKAWLDTPTGQDDAETKAMEAARRAWLSFLRLCVRWVGISIPSAAARKMREFGYPLAEAPEDPTEEDSGTGAFLERDPSESKILSHVSLHLATILARTECDRAFLFLRRAVVMLMRAVNLGMGMEETTEFLQSFYTGSEELRRSVNILKGALRLMGLAEELELPEEVDTVVKAAVEYQSLSMLRGLRMAENIAREMKIRKIDRAMVVQSGFQFPIIAGVLSRRYRIETLQVIPKVVGKEGVEAYRARLMEESDLDEESETPAERLEDDRHEGGNGEASLWLRWLQSEATEEWEKRPLSEHAEFVISRCRADHRTILNVDCWDGDLLLAAAQHCRSAFVMGVSNFSTNLIPSERTPDKLCWIVRAQNLSRRVVLVNSLSRFLPFLDHTFDLVLSDSVDLIFNPGECRMAVRECVRVTSPGGQIRILTRRWPDVVEGVLHREGGIQVQRQSIDFQDGSRSAILFEGTLPDLLSRA